jgi:hypothetical protein
MWLAQCSYVKKLIDPYHFEEAMDQVYPILPDVKQLPDTKEKLIRRGFDPNDFRNRLHYSCRGLGRFSAEHWIYSHPELLPCDLYEHANFTWGYWGLPDRRSRQAPTTTTSTSTPDNGKFTNITVTTSNYDDDGDDGYDFKLAPAPRFWELTKYRFHVTNKSCPQSLQVRLDEYQALYGQTPYINSTTKVKSSWWGFRMRPIREEMMARFTSTDGKTSIS